MHKDIADTIKREYHLIYEMKPQDLTPEDWEFLRQEGTCNGCGSKTGPFANFRPPCGEFFEANCDWHDHGYKKGGSIWRKFRVDYKFFAAMVRDIFRSDNPWYYKAYLLAWSLLYYLAVSVFGWPSYDLRFSEKTI